MSATLWDLYSKEFIMTLYMFFSLHSQNLLVGHHFHPESSTCQSPDLSENIRGPVADRSEGQWAGESSGQSLSLLKARQERLSQEPRSHA